MLETVLIALKLLLAFTTLSFVIAKIVIARIRATRNENHKSVCVIVLGDIGRSPRMNYHCLSLANAGYYVKFIGYKGFLLTLQTRKIYLRFEFLVLRIKTNGTDS